MLKLHISDEEFLRRMQEEDDQSALEYLYERYRQELFVSAYKLLKDKEQCEDILQEVFVDLWLKRKERHVSGAVRNYLFSMVRYQVFKEIRKGSARPELYEDISERIVYGQSSHSSNTPIEYKELWNALQDAIHTLPERCREVYVLSKEKQLSHKEIASKLNISTKTVENQLLKSVKFLRATLKHFI